MIFAYRAIVYRPAAPHLNTAMHHIIQITCSY